MWVIDLHCDTLYELDRHKAYALYDAPLQVNLKKMKAGDYLLQNFAVFTNKEVDSDIHPQNLIQLFLREMNQNHIMQVKSYQDIIDGMNTHQLMGMLTLEEGDIIGDDLSLLEAYYNEGVRMITLTWNYKNRIGYPNVNYTYINNGLTDFGKEYVQKCESLGIIVDVSHASDQTFYDVLSVTSKPIVASHSNARSICHHPRNLTDEMILSLSKKGGVMGINYFKDFVSDDHVSNIENLMIQMDYIKNLAGIDVLALGSDFDGIDDKLELKDASYMPLLYDALKKHHWKESEIEKLFYKNVLRVYQEVLK